MLMCIARGLNSFIEVTLWATVSSIMELQAFVFDDQLYVSFSGKTKMVNKTSPFLLK